jgi:hypothetical protein
MMRLWSERGLARVCERLGDEFLIAGLKHVLAEAGCVGWAQDGHGGARPGYQVGCINVAKAEVRRPSGRFLQPGAEVVALQKCAWMELFQAGSPEMIPR